MFSGPDEASYSVSVGLPSEGPGPCVPETRSDIQIPMRLTEIETHACASAAHEEINLPNVGTHTLCDDPIDPSKRSATTCISACAARRTQGWLHPSHAP
jgi:hypothetical protein